MSNSALKFINAQKPKTLHLALIPIDKLASSPLLSLPFIKSRSCYSTILACLLGTFSVQNTAQATMLPTGSACLPDLISPLQPIPSQKLDAEGNPLPQVLEADSMIQLSKNSFFLKGSTTYKQAGLLVLSDQIRYHKLTEKTQFKGNVEIHQQEMLINADQADLNDKTGIATLENTQFQLLPSRMHGISEKITLQKKSSNALLDRANLTTCKNRPNQTHPWNLHFDEIEINNETRQVIGKNTTLRVKGVPVFYSPYFSYPLDDRASGLLFPEIGNSKALTEDTSSPYIKVPYYFNIAQNMDDTLTFLPMSNRGLVFDNEFRYLAKHSDVEHRANITISALQDNLTAKEGLVSADSAGNLSYGEKISNRWRAKIDAKQIWQPGLTSQVLWQATSDEYFYSDIPVDPNLSTVTQTPRFVRVDYKQDNLQTYVQYLGYLRLRDGALNYEKRPDLGLSYQYQTDDIDINLTANAVDFRMPSSDHTKPEAIRLTLEPTIEHQINRSYGSVKTTLVANQRQYQMHDNGFNNTGANSHALFIPQLAIKGGLVFERQFALADNRYTQTLEPTVQYLYVPYQDQSNLPLFDSGNRSLDFSNLFALNRFTGSDRIGDANQLAMAVTTQLLDDNGRQIANAGIGQIHYLEDRQVGLNGNVNEIDPTSDLFVKLGLNGKSIFYASTAQLDKADFQLKNTNSRLKYQPTESSTLMLNHILTNYNTATEQQVVSLGGYSQIHTNWQLGAYANYDLTQEKIYKYNLGVRYDSCCWASEFTAEHTQLENGLYNDNFQVQFELKGLSTSGQTFRKYLAEKLNF
ncbi:MAG: LPS-assembly protein [Thiomicrorhabdus sp.]|nr:MAG: LPS-assembly protein [Thiomicrorhabdus sp.]